MQVKNAEAIEILDNKEVEDKFSADIGKEVGGENVEEAEDTLVLSAGE